MSDIQTIDVGMTNMLGWSYLVRADDTLGTYLSSFLQLRNQVSAPFISPTITTQTNKIMDLTKPETGGDDVVPADRTKYLKGVVDIGSNGVRFSITDLSPPTSRILPTVFQDRASISLYDAQFAGTTKAPIAQDVIDSVVTCIARFRDICEDFGVPHGAVRVIATEATREAKNSQDLRDAIHTATGWTVELLSKEDEGRIGAQGVASSFSNVSGLVMDLGGGSTQLTWMISEEGQLRMPQSAVSLPYGAAALTKRLETSIDGKAVDVIREEIAGRVRTALETIKIPAELSEKAKQDGGFTLYLSGGGFRGFGYLLLAEHIVQPYPVAIINGFSAPGSGFLQQAHIQLSATTSNTLSETFRISTRRASQVPSVAFLVNTLMAVLPPIKDVIFCQGGLREGCLFETLPQEVRAQNPIVVATEPFAPRSASQFLKLLNDALPKSTPDVFWQYITPALVNLLIYHSNVPKESRSAVAVHFTTTGYLATAHGLTHNIRALLALALCERWGGEVFDLDFRSRLEKLVGPELSWWSRYLGAVARALGAVYPAGFIRPNTEKIRFFGQDEYRKKKGEHEIVLRCYLKEHDVNVDAMMVLSAIDSIEKVGKRKNAIMGYRQKVSVIREYI